MALHSVKAMLEDISVHMPGHLRTLPGVCDVVFTPGGTGAPVSQIAAWDEAFPSCPLPEDLKSFLLLSDGLKLSWSLTVPQPGPGGHANPTTLPLGCMRLSSLRELHDVIELTPGDRIGSGRDKGKTFEHQAFQLDKSCGVGHVGLVYLNSGAAPQVWFRDRSHTWFLIARSFTDYLRLMIMHLGLPSWQYAFTEAGLDPITKQWFRLFCPERLAINHLHSQAAESKLLRETSVRVTPAQLKKRRPKSTLDLAKIEAATAHARRKHKRSNSKSHSRASSHRSNTRHSHEDGSGGGGGASGASGAT